MDNGFQVSCSWFQVEWRAKALTRMPPFDASINSAQRELRTGRRLPGVAPALC
jgi:hypothetical protein